LRKIIVPKDSTFKGAKLSVLAQKVCIVGEFSVGKTSLIRRYVLGLFSETYKATIGVNCYNHRGQFLHPGTGRTQAINLVLWDVEGGQQRSSMLNTYLIGSAGALLIADLTRPETIDSLDHYYGLLEAVIPGRPKALALNKIDLLDRSPQMSQTLGRAQAKAKALGLQLVQTSALQGNQVPELFGGLASDILKARG
jgi:GTPase SAR1 family protein